MLIERQGRVVLLLQLGRQHLPQQRQWGLDVHVFQQRQVLLGYLRQEVNCSWGMWQDYRWDYTRASREQGGLQDPV